MFFFCSQPWYQPQLEPTPVETSPSRDQPQLGPAPVGTNPWGLSLGGRAGPDWGWSWQADSYWAGPNWGWSLLGLVPMDNVKLRNFQYRLLLNKIFVNDTLCKWKIKANDTCEICNRDKQTIVHLLTHCQNATKKPGWVL